MRFLSLEVQRARTTYNKIVGKKYHALWHNSIDKTVLKLISSPSLQVI